MPFERINLKTELENLRGKEISQEVLLHEVEQILQEEQKKEEEIQERVFQGDSSGTDQVNLLNFDLLQSDRIFHRSHIQKICVQYRLRFLDTKYFKGALPHEAIYRIKKLEKDHQTTLKGFQIIAPASYFRLENADDPMLFAPIGNGYFYLIHKWGRDMHPLRKMAMWPLRNIENLMIFCLFSSFLLTFVIRDIFFSRFQADSEFLILFLYTFKSMLALIFFYGISLGKNFSSGNWNSKFYN